jgi:hypothetical protein
MPVRKVSYIDFDIKPTYKSVCLRSCACACTIPVHYLVTLLGGLGGTLILFLKVLFMFLVNTSLAFMPTKKPAGETYVFVRGCNQ